MAADTLKQRLLIGDAVGVTEDLPGTPHREGGVTGEEAETRDSIDRRLEPEEEGLTGGQCREPASARAPEVGLGVLSLAPEELPPSSVGGGRCIPSWVGLARCDRRG